MLHEAIDAARSRLAAAEREFHAARAALAALGGCGRGAASTARAAANDERVEAIVVATGDAGARGCDVAAATGLTLNALYLGPLRRLRAAGRIVRRGAGPATLWYGAGVEPASQRTATTRPQATCPSCTGPLTLAGSGVRHVGGQRRRVCGACAEAQPPAKPQRAPRSAEPVATVTASAPRGIPTPVVIAAPQIVVAAGALPEKSRPGELTPAGGVDLGTAPVGVSEIVIDGRRVRVTRAPAPPAFGRRA